MRASLSTDRTEPFMSIPETLLTFVGVPALIIAVITFAALGPSALKAPARYRPGRPWAHAPAWYIPHPGATPDTSLDGRAELDAAAVPALTGGVLAAAATHAVGGASGEW